MPKWIEFHLTSDQPAKTQRWEVCNKESLVPLGIIRWFGAWRAYVFEPYQDTIYEPTCLRDIAAFCEEHTKARRAG